MLPFGRTVLSMMDDGLYVYRSRGKGAEFIESIPWNADGFVGQVIQILHGKCGGAPVIVINDMVEQYYRKERVFTAGVGSLDKKSMVDRKLAMVFPSYSVRTSIALNEKIQREDSKMASDVYLFAAIASTDQLSSVIAALSRSTVGIHGVGLLPLETVGLVDGLAKKLVPKDGVSAKWKLLIGQHRNGNLRQIVVKDGDIALTRMTQISDDGDLTVWASEVIQEFQSTMSYLSRLGFQPKDGLDVMLIGPEEATETVRQVVEAKYSVYSATAQQAAKLLGLKVSDGDDERYADPLHMAWIMKKITLKAGMPVRQLEPVMQARLGAVAGMAVLSLGLLFVLSSSASSLMSMLSAGSELSAQKDKLARLERQYNAETSRMSDLGVDLPLIQATAEGFNQVNRNEVDLLPFLQSIADVMEEGRVLSRFSLSVVEPVLPEAATGASRIAKRIVPPRQRDEDAFGAELVMVFPANVVVDFGNKELRDFRTRLRKALPGHEVEVTKFLDEFKYIADVGGDQGNRKVQQDKVAEISIKGKAQK